MKEVEMDRTHGMCGEVRNACNILFRRPLGKNPCRKHGSKWEVNITVDIRFKCRVYVELAQGKVLVTVANMVKNLEIL